VRRGWGGQVVRGVRDAAAGAACAHSGWSRCSSLNRSYCFSLSEMRERLSPFAAATTRPSRISMSFSSALSPSSFRSFLIASSALSSSSSSLSGCTTARGRFAPPPPPPRFFGSLAGALPRAPEPLPPLPPPPDEPPPLPEPAPIAAAIAAFTSSRLGWPSAAARQSAARSSIEA